MRETTFRSAFIVAIARVLASPSPVAQQRLCKRIADKLDAGAGLTRRPLRSAL